MNASTVLQKIMHDDRKLAFIKSEKFSQEMAQELVKIIKNKHFGVFKTQIFDTKNNLVVDGTGTALHEEKL